MDYLVTIIVPFFNAVKYIDRLVLSLEELDNRRFMVLFVNDGSNDGGELIIKKLTELKNNYRLISKKNGGYCSAINFGLDNCRSKYVMFLGVDDKINCNRLNSICDVLLTTQPDILFFSTIKIYDDEFSNSEKDKLTDYPKVGYFEEDLFSLCKNVKENVPIAFIRDTSRCFKLTAIGSLRYFGKFGISSDGCFSSLVALSSHSFYFVNEVCYEWHIHKDSLSGKTKSIEKIVDESLVWEKYFSIICQNILRDEIPFPVIWQIWAYRRDCILLRRAREKALYKQHHKKLKEIIKWALKHKGLNKKYRIALMLPSIYFFFRKIFKKSQ